MLFYLLILFYYFFFTLIFILNPHNHRFLFILLWHFGGVDPLPLIFPLFCLNPPQKIYRTTYLSDIYFISGSFFWICYYFTEWIFLFRWLVRRMNRQCRGTRRRWLSSAWPSSSSPPGSSLDTPTKHTSPVVPRISCTSMCKPTEMEN